MDLFSPTSCEKDKWMAAAVAEMAEDNEKYGGKVYLALREPVTQVDQLARDSKIDSRDELRPVENENAVDMEEESTMP
ncbi:unnamed protein product, partial [Nippostrongylus brasiliensis]|uniref:PH domain-containing protein n=1 Tax=Nippostrongylus brasiliensis TaxID=27835 RepID=A0A0N4XK48_NIPBR